MHFCTRGRQQLYDYCQEKGIAHSKVGKLIVASNAAQSSYLDNVSSVANATGTPTTLIPGQEAKAMEPDLSTDVIKALYSPETGIFSSHEYMSALQADVEERSGEVITNTTITSIDQDVDGSWVVETQSGEDEPTSVRTGCVVNASGLECV